MPTENVSYKIDCMQAYGSQDNTTASSFPYIKSEMQTYF